MQSLSHLDSALDAPHLPQERHQQARLAAPGRPVHANQLSRVHLQSHLPQGRDRRHRCWDRRAAGEKSVRLPALLLLLPIALAVSVQLIPALAVVLCCASAQFTSNVVCPVRSRWYVNTHVPIDCDINAYKTVNVQKTVRYGTLSVSGKYTRVRSPFSGPVPQAPLPSKTNLPKTPKTRPCTDHFAGKLRH